MNTNDLDADDAMEESFLRKNWVALTVAALALTGGTFAAIKLASKGGAGTRKAQDICYVQVLPPPPLVLPPPPPLPPELEDPMIKAEDEVPEEAPADNAPSTGIVSNGPPDSFGMRAKGSGGKRILGGYRSPASMWAPYASQAASRIAEAMRRHERLKHSTLAVTARVWIDSTGRVTRATIQPTGDNAIDLALRDEVLSGMQLPGPPPGGMRMPVKLQLTARRPS